MLERPEIVRAIGRLTTSAAIETSNDLPGPPGGNALWLIELDQLGGS